MAEPEFQPRSFYYIRIKDQSHFSCGRKRESAENTEINVSKSE